MYIDIAGCTGFTDEAIIYLLESDTGSIHQLDLSSCTQLNLGIIGLRRHHICTNIKSIKLRHLEQISDSMIEWIAKGCKNLQNVDFAGSRFTRDSTLDYLFKGCKR